VLSGHAESDGKSNFDNNESQLHHETSEQNPVLRAVKDTQTEIFGANEDSANNIPSKEHSKESFMFMRMPQSIEA